MQSDPFANIARKLSRYDSVDLLSTLAGLQLIPENANRAVRFEVLTHIVSSISEKGFGNKKKQKSFISASKLKEFCQCELSEDLYNVTHLEDPFDNSFTEAFSYHGGSYIVFPSIFENTTFILRCLAEAVLLNCESFSNSQFACQANEVFLLILMLSDVIAKRANLERNVEPILSSEVFIPEESFLARLKDIVIFSELEISSILRRYRVSNEIFYRFVTVLGTVDLKKYDINKGELITRPIVKIGKQFIVAIPGALLTAARNTIIALALEQEVNHKLASYYNDAVAKNVVGSLNYIKNDPVPISSPDLLEIACCKDAFFGFDTDKFAYVAIITDPLEEYDITDPLGSWSIDKIADLNLEDRIKEACNFAFIKLAEFSEFGVNELLIILITQGVGRSLIFGLKDLPNINPLLFLTLNAADLETLTLLELGNPLVLWKYASALWKLKQNTEFINWDQLNIFSCYREHRYSFYLTDENKPSFVTFGVGGTGDLRRKIIKQFDTHNVFSWNPKHLIEVSLRYGSQTIPIYVPEQVISRKIPPTAHLVKELPYLIWIVSPDIEQNQQKELINIHVRFGEMIAYWLWQFTPALESILQSIIINSPSIIIQLHLMPDDNWHQLRESEIVSELEPMQIEIAKDKGILDVTMSWVISEWLHKADNSGERQIMRNILLGLRQLLPEQEQELLSDSVIQQILNYYAPLGIKKHFIALNIKTNPELDNADLSKYREIQKADEGELSDRLGTYLSSVEKLKQGKIADHKRTSILQKAVGFYYAELQKLVASLNPEGLLEKLIAYNEAIINKVAEHRLTTPTRLACFETEQGMIEELQKEIPEQNQAAIASRFIIEYVATKPPSGIRPFSLSVYDRLQALASEIINLGAESDLIHFSLADTKYKMLGSGRLGKDISQFNNARKEFLPIHAAGDIVRANKFFGTHWEKIKKSSQQQDYFTQIDQAAINEFGFTITELQQLMEKTIVIGREINRSVAVMPLDDLISQIANQLVWDSNKVSQAIDLLSLKSRTDFLKPEPPFKNYDVLPWKFNRSLSYLRCPFIIRESENKTEVLWGIRHTYRAAYFIKDICLKGKFKARSNQMKNAISKLRNSQGEQFNDQVADLFEQNSNLITKRRVKKVGKIKVSGEKGELGDIDVLVANPKTKVLQVIECKNYGQAKISHEMANERDELFLGRLKKDGQSRKKSAVAKHQERVKWIDNHLSEVLTWLGLEESTNWKVQSLLVTDSELSTPHMYKSPIPVTSFIELSKKINVVSI